MSKAKVKKHASDVVVVDSDVNDVQIYENKRGDTIGIAPISPYTLDDIRKSVVIPDQPTYEINTELVEHEVHLMDETTLEVPGDEVETLRRKQVWADYQSKKFIAEQVLSNKLLEAIILDSVHLNENEPNEQWIARKKRFVLDVPTDPDDLKIYYVLRAIVRTPTEVNDLLQAVLRISEIDERVLQQAEDAFQRALGK